MQTGASPPLDDVTARLLPLAHVNLGASIAGLTAADAYRTSWLANAGLMSHLEQALAVLHGSGVRTLVLKGAALSALHYRDLGARAMSDCDVLVPESQAETAWSCLRNAAWKNNSGGPAEWKRLGQHASTFAKTSRQLVDLHRHTLYACQGPGDDDRFWARSVPLEIGGIVTRALCPADLLLHTIVHGLRWSKHQPIYWIADAVTIIRSSGEGLAWDVLYEEAERRRLLAVLVDGVAVIEDVIPGTVPEDFVRRVRSAQIPLADRVEEWYATGPPHGLLGTLPNYWFRHVRDCRAIGKWPGPAGFARFLGGVWNVEQRGLRQTLLRKVVSRTRSALGRVRG